MAVPTISSISPNTGHTGGGELVEITGTGFQLWTVPPPSNGPAGDAVWPTVDVLFGGRPALRVIVASATRILALPPPSSLEAVRPTFGEGTVDVSVRNVDSTGATIGDETATVPSAYTYRRRQMSARSDLQRLVLAIIREFRRQIIENVSITTHSDYDIDTGDALDIVDVAKLPAIVLYGPTVQENRAYGYPGPIYLPRSSTEFLQVSVVADDITFTFTCISNSKVESVNLQAAIRDFFLRNHWIYLTRDPENESLGKVRYELDFDTAGLAFAPSADQKSNLRSFSGSFSVRGFGSGNHVVGVSSLVTEDPLITSSKKDG